MGSPDPVRVETVNVRHIGTTLMKQRLSVESLEFLSEQNITKRRTVGIDQSKSLKRQRGR
jgi:hypothetical protein